MHALFDALVGLHRDAEKLDAIAELIGGLEIGGRDRGDAFDVDRGRVDADAEGQARQDRKLLRGVVALDVERRIGFGVAQPLRLGETFLERQPLALHARQHVIACTVQNSINPRDGVAGQSLPQRLHDRNGAADRGLEIERNLVLLGERGQFDAMLRQERLVGGDHRLAGLQRRRDRRPRRIAVAADQLDERIDPGIARKLHRVRDPAQLPDVDAAILAARARADRHDLDRPPAAERQRLTLALDQTHHRSADRAETGETHFEGGNHGASAIE